MQSSTTYSDMDRYWTTSLRTLEVDTAESSNSENQAANPATPMILFADAVNEEDLHVNVGSDTDDADNPLLPPASPDTSDESSDDGFWDTDQIDSDTEPSLLTSVNATATACPDVTVPPSQRSRLRDPRLSPTLHPTWPDLHAYGNATSHQGYTRQPSTKPSL